MARRRFPFPPWSVEEEDACFVISVCMRASGCQRRRAACP
jgi:hypothetical protein